MKVSNFFILILVTVLISGCAVTTMKTYHAAGEQAICNEKNSSLGYIAILPETAWRYDQKEPDKRESMALEEIKKAFHGIPCGNLSAPGGIREFSNWSSRPEAELLKQFSIEGVDTIILIRIEELTPYISLTFSLPFLWVGTNEADFRIRALCVKTGNVLIDMGVKRSRGGAFNIRPAHWSGDELNAALHEIIQKQPTE